MSDAIKKDNILSLHEDLNNHIEVVDEIESDYFIAPREFAQNKKLSAEARAVGFYLKSKPKTWRPRPFDIQNAFGFKEHIWRKISKELRDEGYLIVLNNPKDGHRYLKFSITRFNGKLTKNNKEAVQNTPTVENQRLGPTVENPTMGKSTDIDNTDLIQNTDQDLNNNNNSTLRPSKGFPVLDVVVKYMIDFGYEDRWAKQDLSEFGEARCRQVIEHVKKLPERPGSPVGLVRYSLKNKSSLSSKKEPSSPYNDATPIIQHFDSFKKSDNMPIGVKLLAKKLRGVKNGLDN
jgi:hypothetical protein